MQVLTLKEWTEKITPLKSTHIIHSGPKDNEHYFGKLKRKYIVDDNDNFIQVKDSPWENYLIINKKGSKDFQLYID